MVAPRRDKLRALALEPAEAQRAAAVAGLRYVSDEMPGIRRRRCGRGFTYLDPHGRRVTDAATRQRIDALVLPPAWEDVWICPLANGHLQATGRDDAGRKQYRYHDRWRTVRSEVKYAHLLPFAAVLPRLRRRVDRDLDGRALRRERVLATVVRLLDTTLIRVGNDAYAQQHNAFGLTTLRHRHVDVDHATIRFTFQGKSGQRHDIRVDDPTLARIVRRCHDLPGQELFAYLDANDEPVDVGSADVNDYLRQATGRHVTAKDFRTWGGTVLAAITLARLGPPTSKTAHKKNVVRAVKRVAAELGNRPATCRKYYIHPAVLRAYERGRLTELMNDTPRPDRPVPRQGLSAEEQAVVEVLETDRPGA